MAFTIRKTNLSDVEHLPPVERSAGNAFRALPGLAWIADDSVMSTDEHEGLLARGFSWVAVDTLSQAIAGFITAEIMGGDYYIGEISVSETYQQKGIGSRLLETALTEAASLGVSAATLTTFLDVPWNAPYYKRFGFVILRPDACPPYLTKRLQDEKVAGLPIERRCAMRKML